MAVRSALTRPLLVILTAAAIVLGLWGAPTAIAQPVDDPAGSVGTSSAAGPTPIMTGWIPYWAVTSGTANYVANADLFTDVSPFWLGTKVNAARPSGVEPYLQVPSANHTMAMAQLRSAGKPIIPAITDGTSKGYMAAVLADPVKRRAHINELVFIAVYSGYDGLDLDYEGFAFADGQASWAATQPNWVAFVNELAAELHARNLKLTVTVPTSGYWVYDFAAMGRAADSVRIMTYDWSVSKPGPIAPIWWVRQEIEKMRAVIPAEKLMIGVPAYGRDWLSRVISGTCTDSQATSTRAVLAKDTASVTSKPGAVVVRDATADEIKVTYQQTYGSCRVERVAWLADEATVANRVQAAVDGGARGAALWAVGYEDPAKQWAPIRQIAINTTPPAPLPLPAGRMMRVPTGAPNQTVFGMLSAAYPQGSGYLTAFRCDQPMPPVSSLNYQTGRTTPNTVAVRTDANGEFCVYTTATTHVLFDLVAETAQVDTSAPVRVRDTALDTIATEGREGLVPAYGTIEVDTGKPNSLVVGNLTVADPQSRGFTTAWPCSEPRPETSINNFVAGRTIANFAVVRTDAQGKLCVYTTGAARLIWDQSADTTEIAGHTAQRLGDTRLVGGALVPAGMEWRLQVGSPNQTLFGNLTVVAPDRNMFTTLYPCGDERPFASHNYVLAGETVPAFGLVRADAQGQICVYTTANTHLVWDQSAETTLINAHDPIRTVDTRVTQAW